MPSRTVISFVRRVLAAAALSVLIAPALAQAAPTAAFTVSPSTSVRVFDIVSFDASSSAAAPDATYAWDFGDGSSTAAQAGAYGAAHEYAQPGVFTVTLTVSDSTGTSSSQATITVSYSPPTAAFLIDGMSPTDSNPIRSPGETLTFTDQSLPGGGAPIGSFVWNFGDGGMGRGDIVTHAYAQSGVYLASETVTDINGTSAQASSRVLVDAPPFASFTAPRTAILGQTVRFNASASRASFPTGIARYDWDFGDGSTSSDPGGPPVDTNTYWSLGRYQVTLTVTDHLGLSDQHTAYVTVVPPPTVYIEPWDGSGDLQVKPSSISLGRAGYQNRLRWTGWGKATTGARGLEHDWVCTTDCAAGHLARPRPVTVHLSHIRICDGYRQYTWMQIGAGRSSVFGLVCGSFIYWGNQRYPYQP